MDLNIGIHIAAAWVSSLLYLPINLTCVMALSITCHMEPQLCWMYTLSYFAFHKKHMGLVMLQLAVVHSTCYDNYPLISCHTVLAQGSQD